MAAGQIVVLLLDLALVLVLSRLLGALARRFDQPAVIGEILAGILVGPTLFHGVIANTLFPADVRPFLSAFANLGVVLFMFIVGFELDHRLLRGQSRAMVTVTLGSVVPAFGLGALLGWYLLRAHPAGDSTGFMLFLGLAMSVTAFPVLARILHDRRMTGTKIGGLALASAAGGDAIAWSLLALLTMLTGDGHAQWRFLLVVPFLGLLVLVRPLSRRLLARAERTGGFTKELFAFVVTGLLLASALTEWMGLHFIFGAFLFGLLLPKDGFVRVRTEIQDSVQQVGSSLLLPVYFVITGLQVDLSRRDWGSVGDFALIMLAAVGGKFGGVFWAARSLRLDRRQSAALATLMNSRGLTELIILSAGLRLGLLDRDLYSLMVMMAVVTTAITGPLLRIFYPRGSFLAIQEPAGRAAYVPR